MTDGEQHSDGRAELSPSASPDEGPVDATLRPRRLGEFIGQQRLKEKLRIYITAAKRRGSALDHMLISGPPGLGKTTLAFIIGNELGVEVHTTSGPAVDHRGILAGLLTQLDENAILFIDEIHRLNPAVEEYLYPAMEDLAIDVPTGTGAYSQTLRLPLRPFTLVGATTRSGLLTSPLRDRFGIVERLNHYTPEEMTLIVKRSAGILGVEVDEDGAQEIGQRSRGTPRIANRLLRRVRDFAEVQGDGRIDLPVASSSLEVLEVDGEGLDALDRSLLRTVIEHYGGGPVGVDALATVLHEERDTVENEIEPYLIQRGFLQRTPRGRVAMPRAYTHLGLSPPQTQGKLF